jgi:hypothetical protein
MRFGLLNTNNLENIFKLFIINFYFCNLKKNYKMEILEILEKMVKIISYYNT